MDIELLINGSAPSPTLSVVKGQIDEAVNQVTLIELLTVSPEELKESDLEDFVGQPATLKLLEAVDGSLQVSRFDGVIFEFHQMNSFLVEKDVFAYRLIIRPAVWQLNIGKNSHAFRDKSRIDVIDEILSASHSKHYDTNYYKEDDYPPLWQILQTDISDWKFITHQMKEVGINYYFGAPKDGDTEEKMHIIDHSGFFAKGCDGVIPWNPQSGTTNMERHIESFEIQAKSVPESVSSQAGFGDGMTNIYTGKEGVKGGKGKAFKVFAVEGQEEKAATLRAKVLSQGFIAEKLKYHGAGNHFLIRSGERITIGGPYLREEKKILVTQVSHQFERTVPAALTDDASAAYSNTFVGVKADTDLRPIDDVVNIETGGAANRSALQIENADKPGEMSQAAAIATLQNNIAQLNEIVTQLNLAEGGDGIMLGEVVEDTLVTDGKEMTCMIQNERFPAGIKAKVAVAWLVPGGGVTCLPREGMQIYFMFEQGPGGQNEAVVVGYRPSAGVPGRDPAETTKTHRLKKGGGGDTVVEKDDFSPQNRERVGIRGEKSVSEMTILDKEGSVSINATKDIYLISDKQTHMRTTDHLHLADTVGEQFGQVDRYVDREQTEWIKGAHDMRVTDDQAIHVESNRSITVDGNQTTSVEKNDTVSVTGNQSISVDKSRDVSVTKDHTRAVDGNETVSVKKGRILSVKKDFEQSVKGKKVVQVEKDYNIQVKGKETRVIKKAAALKSDDKIYLEAKKEVQIKCGDGKIVIKKNGDIIVKGNKVNQKANSDFVIKGSKVKIN